MAADADGIFEALYSALNENHADEFDDCDIYARRYSSAGLPLGPEFRVNTQTAGNQFETAVAMSGDGRFLVAWMGPSGADADGVLAQRFNPEGGFVGDEFQVNTHSGAHRGLGVSDQGFPTVAMDDDGSFAIAWESREQDGDETGIFGRRFDDRGAPVGAEFQLNIHTESFQEEIGLALMRGRLFGVWISGGLDQDADGIIGRFWGPDR